MARDAGRFGARAARLESGGERRQRSGGAGSRGDGGSVKWQQSQSQSQSGDAHRKSLLIREPVEAEAESHVSVAVGEYVHVLVQRSEQVVRTSECASVAHSEPRDREKPMGNATAYAVGAGRRDTHTHEYTSTWLYVDGAF